MTLEEKTFYNRLVGPNCLRNSNSKISLFKVAFSKDAKVSGNFDCYPKITNICIKNIYKACAGGGGDFLVFLNAKSKEKLKKLFWLWPGQNQCCPCLTPKTKQKKNSDFLPIVLWSEKKVLANFQQQKIRLIKTLPNFKIFRKWTSKNIPDRQQCVQFHKKC